jgi:hypothetical protein
VLLTSDKHNPGFILAKASSKRRLLLFLGKQNISPGVTVILNMFKKPPFLPVLCLSLLLGLGACRRADVTPPEITLNGGDITLLLGSVYTDAGATASDDRDGDLTGFMEVVNEVNTTRTGTYHVTYTVSDFAGNEAIAYRLVVVRNQADSLNGTYSVKDSVWGSGTSTVYTDQISTSTLINNRLITNRFGNLINATVYIDLISSNSQATIPSQTVTCGSPATSKTFSTPANGSVGGNPLVIQFDYQVVEGTATTMARATYTRQ